MHVEGAGDGHALLLPAGELVGVLVHLVGKPHALQIGAPVALGLLARHIETTLLDLAHELRDGSITADPYFRSGQDTACTHCDYLSVCHFTPGVEGDCHRVLTKLPADKIWSSLKGGEMHG